MECSINVDCMAPSGGDIFLSIFVTSASPARSYLKYLFKMAAKLKVHCLQCLTVWHTIVVVLHVLRQRGCSFCSLEFWGGEFTPSCKVSATIRSQWPNVVSYQVIPRCRESGARASKGRFSPGVRSTYVPVPSLGIHIFACCCAICYHSTVVAALIGNHDLYQDRDT